MKLKFFNKIKSTKWKKGVFSAAFIAGAILITLLLNVVAVFATSQFGLVGDFTVEKAYTMSGEAKAVANSVEEDMTIYVLADEDEFSSASAYFYQANQIINLFAKQNSRIKIEYVNLDKNPGFLNNFPDTDMTLYSGDVIVKKGDSYKAVPASNLFNSEETEEGNYYINSSRAESAIAAAILSLTRGDLKKVCVVSDNDPYPTGTISYLLEDNAYLVEEISLKKESVPEDCDVLLLFSPQSDYTKTQIQRMENFLKKKNKTLLYVGDTNQPLKLPNTMALLQKYGIQFGSGVVCETDQKNIYNQSAYSIFAFYENLSFGGKVPQRGVNPLAPFAKPMTAVSPEESGVTVTPLLKYSPTVVVRPSDADSSWSADTAKKRSDLKAMILAQRKLSSGDSSYVLAMSTATFFDSNALTNKGMSNAQYFVSVLNQLTNREDTVAITDKTLGSASLSLTNSQVSTLMVFFTVFVPAAVLATGGLVWFRRRKQ